MNYKCNIHLFLVLKCSQPGGNQSITSIDLHIFHDVHSRPFAQPPPSDEYSLWPNQMYTQGDYSTIIGHGICSPTWFYRLNEEDYYQALTPSALDCLKIEEGLKKNWPGVQKVMRQSIQPLSSYAAIEEKVDTFGVDNVIVELENVAEKKMRTPRHFES